MTVTIIAAVARNGVIGAAGDIPWTLPGEQARFKATTMGHVLVMGRATYESIGRPLPGRTTIVVTRQEDWQPEGGLPDGLLVAGGAQVYAAALPVTDALVMTWVDAEPEGDTFFPQVDWDEWREVSREDNEGWTLAAYERAAKKSFGNL